MLEHKQILFGSITHLHMQVDEKFEVSILIELWDTDLQSLYIVKSGLYLAANNAMWPWS